jgi:hypothetical protein
MSVGRGSGLRKNHRRHTLVRKLHRRLALQRAAASSDAGITLTELLVVLVIMPLILGAIAAAVITSFQDQQGVSGRLTDSASAKTTSAYFVRDVQSATFVTTNASPPSSPGQCGNGIYPGTTPAPGLSPTFEVGLNWGSPTAGGSVITYWAEPLPGTPITWNLVRQYCATGSSTPLSSVNVANGLLSVPTTPNPTAAFTVAVTPSSQATAATANWTSTAGTSSVAIGALQGASTYNFNLVGVPRLYTPQSLGVTGGGTPSPPPLLLLGTGTPPIINCFGSTARLNVSGTAYLNSSSNGSISLGLNDKMTATQIVTANTSLTQVKTGSGAMTPLIPAYSPPAVDPYGPNPPGINLQPPSTSGRPVYSDGLYHGPGVYTTTLTFSAQGTTTLASGVYILEAGITVQGQASINSASGGVFLYITGGSINFSGLGNVTLSPPSPPYTDSNGTTAPNLGIWQAASDSSTLSLSGNGAANIYSGIIYAPTAQVGGTGNSGYTAGGLVASTFACAGNGTANIGG